MNKENKTKYTGYDFENPNPSIIMQRIGRGCDSGIPYKRFKMICKEDDTYTYIDVQHITSSDWDSKEKCSHNCDLCVWIQNEKKNICTKYVSEDIFNKL